MDILVANNENLRRGIPRRCIRWNHAEERYIVLATAFIRRERDSDGLSVDRAVYVSLEESRQVEKDDKDSDRFPIVVSSVAGAIRSLELDVVAKQANPLSANITGLPYLYGDSNTDAEKARANYLAVELNLLFQLEALPRSKDALRIKNSSVC